MKGLVGYYNLGTWWTRELSADERTQILERFRPLSIGTAGDDGKNSLVDGDYYKVGRDVVGFMSDLIGWFQKDPDRHIAYKLITKAEALVEPTTPVLDVHFLYQAKIETCYRDAGTPDGRARCIAACEQQIALAPTAAEAFRMEYHNSLLVEHCGYRRLAMLHEHAGEYGASIRICEQARSQGWTGDWDNRIARCQKRLQKASNAT